MANQLLNFKFQVQPDTVTLASHPPVRVVATGALPEGPWTYSAGVLTAASTGTNTVDGKLLALGDRVLVAGEATGSHNGIYIVTTAGASGVAGVMTRDSDADTSASLQSCSVTVSDGTSYAGSEWIETTQGITLDTTALVFKQVQGVVGAAAAGYGLAESGGALHVALIVENHTTTSNAVTASNTPNAIIAVFVNGQFLDSTDYSVATATITLDTVGGSNWPDGTPVSIIYV